MYELREITSLTISRTCDNGYRAGYIGDEHNMYDKIIRYGNQHRYVLHLKTGTTYYIGSYPKTINGVLVACIDMPADGARPNERLLCIEQRRIFPDGTVKCRKQGVLRTSISGISNPYGVFNTLIQNEDWF